MNRSADTVVPDNSESIRPSPASRPAPVHRAILHGLARIAPHTAESLTIPESKPSPDVVQDLGNS